jgi:hypothetical protein
MHLTGPPGSRGLGPPEPLVGALDELALRMAGAGSSAGIDPLRLLAIRASYAGFTRRGRTSCGGSARLLPVRDGWVAVSLARNDDLDMVPALVEREVGGEPWEAVADWCRTSAGQDVVERGVLLGLPVAALPRPVRGPGRLAAVTTQVHGASPPPEPRLGDVVVVDLSSLWAGPLCGSLLVSAGCTVIKVESVSRPDGAREGPGILFDALNGAKRSVALDLQCREGVGALRGLIMTADVVIEASRPRALRQLGLDVGLLLATGPRVWVSITGHGYDGEHGERIGFGDDAAVAGGLVVDGGGGGPWFCADAVADPLAGLTAAAVVLEALARGGRWHLDVAMSRLAAQVAGPTRSVPASVHADVPEALPVARQAPSLGADTTWALARL